MENIAEYFHVLLVFTSVLFAFSQYNENRQTKIIEKEQDKLREKNFSLADTNEGMRDTRQMWEDIINFEPSTNHSVVSALLGLLILYVISFTIGMSTSWCSATESICAAVRCAISIFSIVLVILSIVIFFKWWKMNKQLRSFKEKVNNFYVVYGTVIKAISSSKRNEAQP